MAPTTNATSTLKSGLTSAEAQARLDKFGPNELAATTTALHFPVLPTSCRIRSSRFSSEKEVT